MAYVRDLMDRSKIEGAIPGVEFARLPDDAGDADVVVIDLSSHADAVAAVRTTAPEARIVCYGRHTEVKTLRQAVDDGADAALPRSSFFSDPASSLTA